MKSVVITGSTRGIGFGLAGSFLSLGCRVMVSGRTGASVERAVGELGLRHDAGQVLGHPCDVRRYQEVEALWDTARDEWGSVDIWINNAGVGQRESVIWDLPAEEIRAVVETNLVGTMYGAKVAMRGMRAQGSGSIYNLEGLGSGGRRIRGLAIYGTSKYGLSYLTDAMVDEARGTPIVVGALSPGMVITELVTGQYEEGTEEWERAKRIFNILADRVETVTPWLARRVLENERSGVRISWLTRRKILVRFLMARFRRRDLFTGGGEGDR